MSEATSKVSKAGVKKYVLGRNRVSGCRISKEVRDPADNSKEA